MAEEQDNLREERQSPDDLVDIGEVHAQWRFLVYDKHQRGLRWYILGALVVIGLLIYAYFESNPLFAIIIILGAFIFTISERRGPEQHTMVISEDGIIAGTAAHPYDELKNFFIIYDPPEVKTLYIEPRNYFQPRMAINLEDQDPNEIRQILLEYLPEDLDQEHEPLSDSWGRFFKF